MLYAISITQNERKHQVCKNKPCSISVYVRTIILGVTCSIYTISSTDYRQKHKCHSLFHKLVPHRSESPGCKAHHYSSSSNTALRAAPIDENLSNLLSIKYITNYINYFIYKRV